MAGFKRRQFLVNAFQYKLLAFSALYLVVIVIVLYSAGVFSLLGDLYDAGLSSRERGESAQVLLHLHEQVLPCLVPLVVAIVLHSVLVSHRIAGPVYRFSRSMKDIARGDLTMVVRLRGKDYLKPEAADLNLMVEALNSRILQAQESCLALRGELANLEGLVEGSDPGELAEHATALRSHSDELALVLGEFKTRARSSTIHEQTLIEEGTAVESEVDPPQAAA